MAQLDMAVSRDFPIREKIALQFRVDAFNALNHPNFADPVRYLDNPLFGQSSSMLNMMLGTGSPGSGLSPLLGTGGHACFNWACACTFRVGQAISPANRYASRVRAMERIGTAFNRSQYFANSSKSTLPPERITPNEPMPGGSFPNSTAAAGTRRSALPAL